MPVTTPGMTPGYTFYGKPTSFKGPVFSYRFYAILRTSGSITAGGWEQWRYQ
ncbi:hypothetical protein SAMN05216436_10589 [bacterium A37T11]|nr:hypothetical protein SAMN05216436_10589 [bacterium A37T11]